MERLEQAKDAPLEGELLDAELDSSMHNKQEVYNRMRDELMQSGNPNICTGYEE